MPSPRLSLILTLTLLPLALLATACGDGEHAEGPQIVASTGVMADLARSITGADAEVRQLIPDGVSPHAFMLSARDRAALEEAALVVLAGGDLETGIPTEDSDAPQWQLLDQIPDPLPFAGEPDGAEENAALDPHSWLDPARVSAAIPSLTTAISAADSANAAAYERRGARFSRRLDRLDGELERTFSRLSAAERTVVSSHDALGYLADRYGLELLISPFGAAGPEGEVSAARLQDVIDAVRESGTAAVYAQQTDNAEVLERIASEAGVEVREGLLIESPGTARSYLEMMRANAALIGGD